MSHPPGRHPYDLESAKLGIWIFLGTEVMLFGALFTLYILFRLQFPDLFHAESLKLNRVFGAVNTLVLIGSSFTLALAIAALKDGKAQLSRVLLAATVALALLFLAIKGFEYREKFHHHLYPGTNLFFSLYFSMTALHALHVIAGIIALCVVLAGVVRGKLTPTNSGPLEIAGIYWHFVDLVWIYLFPLLYLIG